MKNFIFLLWAAYNCFSHNAYAMQAELFSQNSDENEGETLYLEPMTMKSLVAMTHELSWPGLTTASTLDEKSLSENISPIFSITAHSRKIYENFDVALTLFAQLMQNQMKDPQAWFGQTTAPTIELYNPQQSTFVPFVQKKVFQPGAQIAIWGDLHGGFHSFINTLNYLHNHNYIDEELRIIHKNFHLLFLGDYVDRGMYGVEVLYVLIQLKLMNPEQVFLVRGNHEDLIMNQLSGTFRGFSSELIDKFGTELASIFEKLVNRFYNLLPLAFYIDANKKRIQASHGGIDLHYDARSFLEDNNELVIFDFLTKERYFPQSIVFQMSTETIHGLVKDLVQHSQETLQKATALPPNFINGGMNFISTLHEDLIQIFNKSFMFLNFELKNRAAAFYSDSWMHKQAMEDLARELETIEMSEANSESFSELIRKFNATIENIYSQWSDLAKTMAALPIFNDSNKNHLRIFIDKKADNINATYNAFLNFWAFRTKSIQTLNLFTKDPMLIEGVIFEKIRNPTSFLGENKEKILRETGMKPGILDLLLFDHYQDNTTHPLTSYGMVWNDFIIDPTKTARLDFLTNRWAFGRLLTQETLAIQGVSAIFRAHQHYGDMAELLKKHAGVAALWDYDNGPSILNISEDEGKGLVFTFQVAQSSGMLDSTHDYDPFGLFIIGKDEASMTLEKINVPHPKFP